MDAARLEALRRVYRDGLLDDTVPFWVAHAPDREYGGFVTSLDRDGAVIDTDKAMWQQGRFTWLLSTLFATVEPREEWLDLARSGVEFVRRHGFDDDGRMLFLVTRDGRPLRKRRYFFTEAFTAMAFAAYARAADDASCADEASRLYRVFCERATAPGASEPKVDPRTRPAESIGPHMIAINAGQVLRDAIGDPDVQPAIDRAIEAIAQRFVDRERRVVLETVGPGGAIIDHFDGRLLNPGHAIEAAWFILHEARRADDESLRRLGLDMLDWMWERGWDEEHGGLLYFRDVDDLPVQEYWHDMKFWWPHAEAIIATLLAWTMTADPVYAERHALVHAWAHDRFRDPEHGEWFGYLHRDGRLSVPLKGNTWKGPFHVPRMQWYCWRLLEGDGGF